MKPSMFVGLFAVAGVLSAVGTALAFDVKAGPIWSNGDAQNKCPQVCGGLSWNGQWTTTDPGKMSVCGTSEGVDVPVGPIWNNTDAQTKCPNQLKKVSWSGQWTTTDPGKMSVCGCNPP
jgi:hypothetical protein